MLLLAIVSFILYSNAKELYEAFGPRQKVTRMRPHSFSTRVRSAVNEDAYRAVRTQENCTFPLDVLIIQDVTQSLGDDLVHMRESQIPAMISGLSTEHPGSRFAVLTHRDKPIWPLGSAGDYCARPGSPFSIDGTIVLSAYTDLEARGGADGPESQFVALLAASQLSMYEWNPMHTHLIVVATDAQPHFNLDGFNTMNLPAAPDTYDENDPETQCSSVYYPSPEQVKSSLNKIEAYLAAVIYDPDYQNGLIARSWQWVIRDFGETDDFLNLMSSDARNFWEKLAKIISELEATECIVSSTSPAPLTTSENTFSGCPPCTTRQCQRRGRKLRSTEAM